MTHIFGLKHFQEKDLLLSDLAIREFVSQNMPAPQAQDTATKSQSMKNRSQMNMNSKTIDFSKNLGMPKYRDNEDSYEQYSGMRGNSRLGSIRKQR